MVSKARLDLPDPERPVITVKLSRGISSEMSLRLWTRAPCTRMVVRRAVLAATATLVDIEERQFVNLHVASLREPHRQWRFPDQSLVGQILARAGHLAQTVVPL